MSDFYAQEYSLSEEFLESDVLKMQNIVLREAKEKLEEEKKALEFQNGKQNALIQSLENQITEILSQMGKKFCYCPSEPNCMSWRELFDENIVLRKRLEQFEDACLSVASPQMHLDSQTVFVQMAEVQNSASADTKENTTDGFPMILLNDSGTGTTQNTIILMDAELQIGANVDVEADLDQRIDDGAISGNYVEIKKEPDFVTETDTNYVANDLEPIDHNDPDYDPGVQLNLENDSDLDNEAAITEKDFKGEVAAADIEKLMTENISTIVERQNQRTGRMEKKRVFLCKFPCPEKCRIATHGVEKFSKLKSHYRTKHLKNPNFYCDLCSKFYINKKSFKEHNKTKH